MMRMKKWLSLVLVFLLASVFAAGCQNNPTGSNTGKENSSASTASEGAAATGEKVKIQISVSGSAEEMNLRKEIGDLYTAKNPNVQIEWIDIGNERLQKTMALISGGQAPDILYVNEKVFALADLGVVEPLDDLIAKDKNFDINAFYPNLIDVLKYEGKLYGLPQEISPFVIYYNKTMFEQKGVKLPTDDWTIDEFYAAAKALTDTDNKVFGYRHPANWADQILGWVGREDVPFYNADATATGWDAPGAATALEFLRKMVVEDKISPDPADAQAMGKGFDAMFRNQKVAMQSAGLWDLPVYKAEPLDFEFDVVKMPKSKNQSTKAGVLNWCISKDSKNKDVAWDVLKFFTGTDGQQVIAKYNMALPSIKDETANNIILDSKFPENVKTFIDAVEEVDMKDQLSAHREEVQQVINAEVDLLLLGEQSVEETQKNIVEKSNGILGK